MITGWDKKIYKIATSNVAIISEYNNGGQSDLPTSSALSGDGGS